VNNLQFFSILSFENAKAGLDLPYGTSPQSDFLWLPFLSLSNRSKVTNFLWSSTKLFFRRQLKLLEDEFKYLKGYILNRAGY